MIVDKSQINKICIDDFAFRKRYTYGTVMVDLETHKIVDIIDTRDTSKVAEWLKTYPNIKVVCRDGARSYSSATSNAHPLAIQVSDRFHLLKNLSEAAEKYMRRLFPSRLSIPATEATLSPAMQVLYNTRNRSERIGFARQKRAEGYTVNDLTLLLHSSATTILRYLSIPENELPKVKENACERRHTNSIKQKQSVIEEVKKFYSEGCSVEEISQRTGHTSLTITKYLKEDCSAVDVRYDNRQPGKLAPYEQDVIQMRSQGITYTKVHEHICENGYDGTIASLRVFMQKERARRKRTAKKTSEPTEYIPRKFMCQLIYRKLENIKGLTMEQYDSAVKQYPVLGQLYILLKEFHQIVFSSKGEELDAWMESALSLHIEELNSYISGLKNDLDAVKNGIKYTYNNGLAEGSVNKIKVFKRIMYGRNHFPLLKAKILLNEYYR